MDFKGKRVFSRLVGLLALSGLLVFSVYPFFHSQPIPAPVTVSSPVPVAEPPVLRFEDTVPPQSTFQEVLLENSFPFAEVHRLIQDVRPVYDLNRVRAGNRYIVERLSNGTFQSLRYDINDEEYLLVRYPADGYVASRHAHEF